jgi:hypothetical protein
MDILGHDPVTSRDKSRAVSKRWLRPALCEPLGEVTPDLAVRGIFGEVGAFPGILLEIEEDGLVLHGINAVLEVGMADGRPRGSGAAEDRTLVIRRPRLAGQKRSQASTVEVEPNGIDTREVERGQGEVVVLHQTGYHATARHPEARVDERNTNQVLEREPGSLRKDAPVPGIVAVVGGEGDQRRRPVQAGHHATDGVVDVLDQAPHRGQQAAAARLGAVMNANWNASGRPSFTSYPSAGSLESRGSNIDA